jgi:hypothetical protein
MIQYIFTFAPIPAVPVILFAFSYTPGVCPVLSKLRPSLIMDVASTSAFVLHARNKLKTSQEQEESQKSALAPHWLIVFRLVLLGVNGPGPSRFGCEVR